MNFQEFLNYSLFTVGDFQFTLSRLAVAVLILFAARIASKVLKRLLNGWFRRREVDEGRRFVISRSISYALYTIALLLALQALGIKLSLLWGGVAALLVGVGLGLQQTFNDFFSGIILLVEASVEVGDIVMVDQMIAKVRSIGLRTSKVETRDSIVIIIPNSKLVAENVTNWSHNDQATRFQLDVGVAYSSDETLVTKLLLDAALDHPDVLKNPPPKIQFKDFGSSSLDFTLHFYTEEFFRIEFVRSELRYAIRKLFREHGVEIPFPQRDLWLKNPETLRIAAQTEIK